MRSNILCGVALGAISLVASTTFVAGAASGVAHVPSPSYEPGSAPTPRLAADASSCYEQLANDTGVGIDSQSWEKAYSADDSRGADDFTLDAPCTVTQVHAPGIYFGGAGPARSVHVTFYQDNDGTPGTVINGQKNLSYTDSTGTGDLLITLKRPIDLDVGHYWISVKVNMSYEKGGEWGWYLNSVANGVNAQWRNSRDGFGTGCTTYTDVDTCTGYGSDFAFALIQ